MPIQLISPDPKEQEIAEMFIATHKRRMANEYRSALRLIFREYKELFPLQSLLHTTRDTCWIDAWDRAHPGMSKATRHIGETRGSLIPGAAGAPAASAGENLRAVLDPLLGKLDALADRPIEVSVTTLLDGRQVAQSVYRDIRERKIKNYETS